MAREIRWINLGAGGKPETFAAAELPGGPGQNGALYLDGINRYQSAQIVDAGAIAGDVPYWKSYNESYKATMTVGNSSTAEPAGVVTTTVAENYYCLLKQGGLADVKANGLFARGVVVIPDSASNRVVPDHRVPARVALGVANTAAGVLSWQNPYSDEIYIHQLIVDRNTASSGAGTVDFGVAATAILNDTLIDGLDVNAAAGIADSLNDTDNGTNGAGKTLALAAGSYVTGSTASGSAAGLAGFAYIRFSRSASGHVKPLGVAQAAISSGKVSTFLELEAL